MTMNKCPKCGSTDVDEGKIWAGVLGKEVIIYVSKKPKGISAIECKTKSYICLKCGYIETHADESSFEKFKEELNK